MRIRFLVDHMGYSAGDVETTNYTTGHNLCYYKCAEEVKDGFEADQEAVVSQKSIVDKPPKHKQIRRNRATRKSKAVKS